jgi:hypothetical protein
LIDGGFVYWTRRSDKERSAIFRRALQPGSAPQFVSYAYSDPLAIANGQIYYADEDAIWSAPVQGGAPTKLVAIGSAEADSVVVDRGCLYWTNHRAIVRLGLAGKPPVTPEAIADELTFRGGAIATDGQYLYWLDGSRNRIWRAGRDAHARPPLPTLLARPADWACVWAARTIGGCTSDAMREVE